MLKNLRKRKIAKKIWIILAILIVPAFVLWGSGSLIRSKKQTSYAGKISGRKISLLEFKDSFDAVRVTAIIQYGDKFSEIQQYLNLETQAWQRLILLYEAGKRKINVTNREVIELIESYPFFQRKGKFDHKLYSEILRYVFRTRPRTFEEHTRQNLILSKLYKQLTDNISLNEQETRSEYQKLNEEISLYYIASLSSEFAKNISPAQQEIKDYFAKNQLQFKQPLSFNLEYIVLESESKIKDVSLRLNRKTDFEKVAKELGLTLKETGLFTQTQPIPGIGWSPEILNLLAKFKVGEYSPPIHIDKYYYILRLKQRKEAHIPDFEKIKAQVEQMFIKVKSGQAAKEKIEECLKKLKALYKLNPKQIDFNKTAREFALKSDSTGMFKYGSYIEGIGGSDNLWLAAKGLKEGEFSEVINMPSGFYIVKLKSRIPMDEQKFQSEKSEFSQKLLLQKKEEYFAKFQEELQRNAQMF